MWYWLFIKEKTNQFIVLSDEQLDQENRWILIRDDYELISDSFRSVKDAEEYAKTWYRATKLKLETMPVTLKSAGEFVNQHHRHHKSPQGHKFSVALSDGDLMVGVVIAGRPVSRHHDDGYTLEITRCCVKEIYKNGISKLYSSVCQIAKAMGYKKVITYTLVEEPGNSLRASGFNLERVSNGGSWDSLARKRIDKHPTGKKNLWLRKIS
ncbi:XF1762 family protein [Bacillus sp. FJAT-29937]|uniref:XF1762 family protein n=1 Tax=Bacillus sp. FJAT-29937 TaxID=1720553 RepID=UPI000AAC05D8|nr:XF1762 family protein [Bacillus sp. FJAT-29937]